MAAAPSELTSSSIEILRAEMDEMIAWSNKLRCELDLNAADHYARMDQLVSAHRELSIKYDVLQSKFDHFIDEHWRPMQHFTCGVVSCLAVFAGDCQGGPRRSPEIQSTLVWSSCWGATGSAGRSTQRGEQRRVVRARGNKGEVGVTRDQCRVW